jgi:uncharacterized protein YutE (UPF0331/DUF86 family)
MKEKTLILATSALLVLASCAGADSSDGAIVIPSRGSSLDPSSSQTSGSASEDSETVNVLVAAKELTPLQWLGAPDAGNPLFKTAQIRKSDAKNIYGDDEANDVSYIRNKVPSVSVSAGAVLLKSYLTDTSEFARYVMARIQMAVDCCQDFSDGIKKEANETGSKTIDEATKKAKFTSWYDPAMKAVETYMKEGEFLHYLIKDDSGKDVDLGVDDEEMFQDPSSAGKIQYVWMYAYDYVIDVVRSAGSALGKENVSVNNTVIIGTPDSDPADWGFTYGGVKSGYYTYDVYKTLKAFDSGEYLNQDSLWISGKPTLDQLKSELADLCSLMGISQDGASTLGYGDFDDRKIGVDGFFSQKESAYLVYAYEDGCDACGRIEQTVLSYAKSGKYRMYLLPNATKALKKAESADACKEATLNATEASQLTIFGAPTMYVVETAASGSSSDGFRKSAVTEIYVGSDEITSALAQN